MADLEPTTVKIAANRLQVSTRTVRRWLRSGKLRGYLIDRDNGLKEWRVDAASLRTIQRGRQARPTARETSLDTLSEEIRLLREQNAEYLTVIAQLVTRLATLESAVTRLLPAAPEEKASWWRRVFAGGRRT